MIEIVAAKNFQAYPGHGHEPLFIGFMDHINKVGAWIGYFDDKETYKNEQSWKEAYKINSKLPIKLLEWYED
jgi:hypothetical protein